MEAHQIVSTTERIVDKCISASNQEQRASAALLPVDASVSGVFKAGILDGMAHDKISFIVRQDQLIIILGKHTFAKSGREAHEISM